MPVFLCYLRLFQVIRCIYLVLCRCFQWDRGSDKCDAIWNTHPWMCSSVAPSTGTHHSVFFCVMTKYISVEQRQQCAGCKHTASLFRVMLAL